MAASKAYNRALKLWATQEYERRFISDRDRGFILSGVGMGKTPTMLTAASDLLADGKKVAIVTKKSLVRQLKDEAARWLPPKYQPVEWEAARFPRDESRPIVLTYDLMNRRIDQVVEVGFDVVLADEAHHLCGGSVVADSFRRVAAPADKAFLFTATPVQDLTGLDLIHLMHAGGFVGVPTPEQHEQHFILDRLGRPTNVDREGRETCQNLIRRYGIRHEATAGMVPTVNYRTHPVPAPPSHHRQRDQRTASRNADCLVPEVVRLLATVYAHHDKAVIFTENFDLLEPLRLALKRAGIGHLAITGKADAKKRADFIRQWASDPNVRVLLGTSVLEQGLNLQRASLVMAVVETYVPQRGDQLAGRIARPGSTFTEVDYAAVHMDIGHEKRKASRSEGKFRLAYELLSKVPTGQELAALESAAVIPSCVHGPLTPRSGVSARTGLPYHGWYCLSRPGPCRPEWHQDTATWDYLSRMATPR